MGSYPDEFPFGIMEVVNLLNLRIRRQQANSVYVDCPFCGDRRGRMNVNFVKNVWRCNHCDAHGGMKPNNGRPAHALQLRGPGLPLPVILLPSEKQYHSRIRPVQRRSTRRYPCCLLNLRCGRRIGSICAPLNAGCLMNRLTHWALRVPHRLFYAGLLQNG